MFVVFALLVFTAVKAEVVDEDVKHIENIVEQSIRDAFLYKRPNNAYEYQVTNNTLQDYGTFDYIIVGAGSAGAVIATRLSENSNVTILLIEAGDEGTTFSDVTGMMVYLQGSKLNWNFQSTPQTTCCLGMFEKRCSIPRGKGFGGSSIINAAMYVRGNKDDYDSWAKAGNDGWSFEEVLPFFIKSENSQIDGDSGYHGKGGLLNVEYIIPNSPITYAFIKANQELGRKELDYNGREQLGVSRTQFTTLNGHRYSTGKAFLNKAKRRKQLSIAKNSYVKKVLINNKKKAFGVLFDKNAQAYVAKARKEIILSAGAIGSPQLLMLSGVGPASVLSPLGIPVVSDLPVGQNYQDHPTVFALFFSSNYSEPAKTQYEYSQDYLNGEGPFTVGANAQGVTFLRTKIATTALGVPDIEVIIVPQNASNLYFQQTFNYNDETFNTFWSNMDYQTTFSVFLILLHPKSKGTITLNSANPYEYPNIDINFLSDVKSHDIKTMYEGINMVREMLETDAFRKFNAKLIYRVLPACRNYSYMSKEQWFCQIRQLTTHVFHPIGTCKMAPSPEKGGVVNNELKVHGVKNLRVADASVIPYSTSGHTNAPVIMIGEKLAHMLKNEI